ncbi:hypothetical protein HPB47_019957 [Ixodes persulcatus]|uniref:Uncharacterized protein n=1 Tax=Ixodes persulcatus TaxID=34615 RepID=A0AC60QKB0_IXOPE|nr:hypothetical protein HPB47_019957 [Ixodes persulcatus]
MSKLTWKVRYSDTSSGDALPAEGLQDLFQFWISSSGKREGPFDFRLSFESVQAVHNEQLTLEGILEGVVSAAHLTYTSWPSPSSPDIVVYTLEQPPQMGNLVITSTPMSSSMVSPSPLGAGDQFTQRQIDQGVLRYQLRRRALVRVSDSFRFHVSAGGGAQARDQEFRVCHLPKDAVLVSEELTVTEGGQATLGGLRPLLQGRQARFNVTRLPTFKVSVSMRNDNPPVRVVDRVFQVVADSERPLTSQDLKYEDVDSPPSEIQYTRRDIPNGALFHADNMGAQVYHFSQADLDAGKIVFRHSGPPSARALLWVTDGQYYASGVLEIRASKPFLRVSRNTGLVVRRGDAAPLSSANLSAETNLRAGPGAIAYKVTSHPRRGLLLVGGAEARQFSQGDLDSQAVEYESADAGGGQGEESAYQDSFEFVAFLGDTTSAPSTFRLTVYPDSFWEPLNVLRNGTLFVDQGTRPSETISATPNTR